MYVIRDPSGEVYHKSNDKATAYWASKMFNLDHKLVPAVIEEEEGVVEVKRPVVASTDVDDLLDKWDDLFDLEEEQIKQAQINDEGVGE